MVPFHLPFAFVICMLLSGVRLSSLGTHAACRMPFMIAVCCWVCVFCLHFFGAFGFAAGTLWFTI